MSIDVLPSCSTTFYDPTDKTGRHLAESKQYNRRSSKSSSHGKYETTFVQNTVALAVIRKLQHWCCQLFWLTIVCVIGIGCGELNSSKQKTLKEVNRRCKTLTDLELQLLRHLTHQTSVHRPLRPTLHKKQRLLSRMPSPNLFDIREDDESME